MTARKKAFRIGVNPSTTALIERHVAAQRRRRGQHMAVVSQQLRRNEHPSREDIAAALDEYARAATAFREQEAALGRISPGPDGRVHAKTIAAARAAVEGLRVPQFPPALATYLADVYVLERVKQRRGRKPQKGGDKLPLAKMAEIADYYHRATRVLQKWAKEQRLGLTKTERFRRDVISQAAEKTAAEFGVSPATVHRVVKTGIKISKSKN